MSVWWTARRVADGIERREERQFGRLKDGSEVVVTRRGKRVSIIRRVPGQR